MDIPESLFGQITVEDFLRDYWQKRSLLVRSAWPQFLSPLEPEDLIQLAQRDDTDSRLILRKGGEYEWEARFGPFDEEEITGLGESHWTLLVQEVDRMMPEVSALLRSVPFLSNWRIDDVMVTYATDGGGVGAHIDNYNVFLLQGLGKRKWEVEERPAQDEELVPDLDVRILSHFEPTDTWILEPGDMLYLPPRIAHRGTAVGDCLTYSIGCRAPSKSDLVSAYLEDLIEAGMDETPFSGGERSEEYESGLIAMELKEFAHSAIAESIRDTDRFTRWMGRYLSRPSRGRLPPEPKSVITSSELRKRLEEGAHIRASSVSMVMHDRFSDGSLVLFVGGEEHNIETRHEKALVSLTGRQGLELDRLPRDKEFTDLMCDLINQGYLLISSFS